jgi:aminoglycoside 3-N-acetyltransferase
MTINSKEIAQQLTDAANKVITAEEDVIIIHAALSKLGYERSDTYLNGLVGFLNNLLDQGKTVIIPSFTFSAPKKKYFDINKTPSETGALADIAREHAGFDRTPNPMYSFAIKGPKADEFINARNDSGYGKDTAVARLAAPDVGILYMNAPWNTCTVVHYAEEDLMVPFREHISWTYPADFGDGPRDQEITVFVRKLEPKSDLRYNKIKDVLEQAGELRHTFLNGALIEGANSLTAFNLAQDEIRKDPYFFVDLLS